MIRINSQTRNSYLALTAAAAVMTFTCTAQHASAQMLGNIFGGSNGTNPTSVSIGSTLTVASANTATIGPGFSTTVGLAAGVGDNLTASLNAPTTPGELIISETGVAAVAGNFSADKTFTGVNLTASTPYQFVLTKSVTTQISLLNDVTLQITVGGVQLYNANILSLFTGGNTATVNYTTPANLNPTGPLELTLSGDTTVGLLGGQVIFSSATFDQVPEPGTGTAVATGLGLLGGAQLLRRARRA